MVWGLETGVGNGMGSLFKCFISHFYFQESLKLAFEVSELDWLAPWGRGGWGWACRSCCVSLLWSISSQDLSLRVAGSRLPPCYFLIWVDSLPALTRPSPSGS